MSRSPFLQAIAKFLCFMMVIQGWPLMQLSHAYRWEFDRIKAERIIQFLSFIEPDTAEAAPHVITVPFFPGDLLVPHETWSGETVTLKGVLKDPDDTRQYGYYWTFGDGSVSPLRYVTDNRDLSFPHIYNAAPDTLFIATLNLIDINQGDGPFFYDSFDADSLQEEYSIFDLGYTSSAWSIDNGLLLQTSNTVSSSGPLGTILIKNQEEYADLSLTFEISGTDNDTVGLILRFQDRDNFYVAWLNEQESSAEIGKYISGIYTAIGSKNGTFDFNYKGSHILGFSARGNRLELSVDGAPVLTALDTTFASGRFGLGCGGYNGLKSEYLSVLPNEDAHNPISSDEYRIIVREKTLHVEVNKAIDDALWWLYTNRETTPENYTRWNNLYNNHNYYGNTTASAVQAFEINGHLESGDPEEDPYVEAVKGGMAYLLSQLSTVDMEIQAGNDPDSNHNGIGLTWPGNRQVYEQGAVMDALIASGTPDQTASYGGLNVLGRRYQDIVQDMADTYAYGQDDYGDNRGGWRYAWNSSSPDNSAAQWGGIGLAAAERHFDCTVPEWVKEQNKNWLDYSYNDAGYFGYLDTQAGNSGFGTGPGGMVQMAFDGIEVTSARWQQCMQYLEGKWASFSGWNASSRTYKTPIRFYAYYGFVKAMRLANPREVTHMPGGLDWYGDDQQGLATVLVNRQNPDGSWPMAVHPTVGIQTAVAWNIIVLTRTLFEKPPVAVIHAEPDPGAIGMDITLDASDSYHIDPAKQIVGYLWDFDASDGVDFEHPDATGVTAAHTFGELGDYIVSLKVIDNSTPVRFDTSTFTLHVTVPPHPPTAVVGGPYIAATGEDVHVNGSGSYDIDQSLGDSVTAWDWEGDLEAPYNYDDAHGINAVLPPFEEPGVHDIILRVSDNTQTVFPDAGQPDLSDTDFGHVKVYIPGVTHLTARAKDTKCELTWNPTTAEAYRILRSTMGPNEGFVQIGTTTSDYSVFIDHNLAETPGEPVNACRGDLNNDFVVDTLDAAIFTSELGSSSCSQTEPCKADFDRDGDVDGVDSAFFQADMNRTGCLQVTGIEMNRDYWYRIMTEVDGITRLSEPVFVHSGGKLHDHPPVITSSPVEHAQEASAYEYDVDAIDPEGTPLIYILDLAPEGMEIEQDTGMISWVPSRDQAGIQDVMVRVQDGAGISATQFFQVMVAPRENSAPSVHINGPYSALINETINFSASATDPEDDALVSWHWSFGDGTEITGEHVAHSYEAPGRYTVTLFVTDDRGATGHAETSCVISMPNRPPVADITSAPTGFANSEMLFDASSSYDPDGDVLSCTWSFGDGTQPASGLQVSHIFIEPGTYTITLGVDDGRGGSDSAQSEIIISPPNQPPVADFSHSGTLAALETITFDAGSSTDPDGIITSWQWDFGDGIRTTGKMVTHVYSSTGTYTVTLTVSDNLGLTDTTTRTITVSENQPPQAVMDISGNLIEGDTITFSAARSSDPEGASITCAWAFGDGATASGLEVNHAYAAPGSYNVELTVTDPYGLTDSAGNNIIIQQLTGPRAIFSISGDPVINNELQFDGSASTAQQGHSILSYQWDFGDGSSDSSGPAVNHTYTNPGNYQVTLRVTDDQGSWHQTGRTVTVYATPNRLPSVRINAPESGVEGLSLTFSASGSDPDGNPIEYSWTFGDGSAAQGVSTTHAFSQAGTYTVTVTVTDSRNGQASDSAQVEITQRPDHNVAPVAQAGGPYRGDINQEITFDASNSYDLNLDTLTFHWDFGDGTTGSGIMATHAYSASGPYTATLQVTDPDGLMSTDSAAVRIIDTSDQDAPAVTIESPVNDSTVTEPVDITGTISADDTEWWRLEYAEAGTTEFVEFASGSGEITSDVLGQFDPTMLVNGIYDIRLTAGDFNGNTSSDTVQYLVKGNMKLGIFTVSFTDMNIPLVGIPIQIIRTYDSRLRNRQGDFGYGWNLSVRTYPRINKKRAEGSAWVQNSSGGTWPTYSLSQMADHLVTVTMPDGRILEFDFTPSPSSQALAPLTVTHAQYTARPGSRMATLAPKNSNEELIVDSTGGLYTYNGDIYNPRDFILTMENGTKYEINIEEGLKKITDGNGNYVEFTQDGIIHSCGLSIDILRDKKGRIIRITDPQGNSVNYTYDNVGNLETIMDQMDYKTRFVYLENHYLQDIINHGGIRAIRNEYDEAGRLVASIDADNNRIEYEHLSNHRQEIIRDRKGNATVYQYDSSGNTTVKFDALGHRWEYSYDSLGNKLSETDPLGNTKRHEYDSNGHIIKDIDALNNITEKSYNSLGLLSELKDSLGNIRRAVYDAHGNIIKEIDQTGGETTYTYNNQGLPLSKTDALGNTTYYEYDNYGNQTKIITPSGNEIRNTYDKMNRKVATTISRTDAEGHPVEMTRTWTYDLSGRVIQSTDFDGLSTITEYDYTGKKTAFTNKSGYRTEYKYDARGNLIEKLYPDGSKDEYQYDENGNKIWGKCNHCNGAGTTEYAYDALNRKIKTIYPDGSYIEKNYNEAGWLTKTIDANGNAEQYIYDKAGRKTAVIDALGHQTTFAYDATGHTTAMTDALGRTTYYDYNPAGLQTKTIFADGTYVQQWYDAAGRKTRERDQAGVETKYTYDADGHLTEIIDGLGNSTSYQYDEMGNKISQTTPDGQETRWEYDNMGRIIKEILPLGMSRTLTYYPNGKIQTETDFNGSLMSYQYDEMGRLTRKTYDDGSFTEITYNNAGLKSKITDSHGDTVYEYDSRGRITGITEPGDIKITYSYDGVGNRLSMEAPTGIIRYNYDAANRLVAVIYDNQETTYHYDNAGNRIGIDYPNGVKVAYQYDTLNRLIQLSNTDSSGSILSSYTYTLGPAGNRVKVEENSGRVVNYVYDPLYRLTAENISDPVYGDDNVSYTYDEIGNRLTRTDSSGTTTYSYDANERLLSETGTQGTTSYAYDLNGNLKSKITDTGETSYTYNQDNSLVSVVTPSGMLTTYQYDFSGIKIAEQHDGNLTRFILDRNRTNAQILGEIDETGNLKRSYIYGDHRIALKTEGTVFYYLHDGSMSTRSLVDDTGNITDNWVYDSFGKIRGRDGVTYNPFLFDGEEWDANIGFYYLRARWMNPDIGRFISQDTFTGSIFEPQSLHRYVFARNNPVMNQDPSGFADWTLAQQMVNGAMISVLVTASVMLIKQTVTGVRYSASEWVFQLGLAAALGIFGTLLTSANGLNLLANSSESVAAGLSEALQLGESPFAAYMVGRSFLAGFMSVAYFMLCMSHSSGGDEDMSCVESGLIIAGFTFLVSTVKPPLLPITYVKNIFQSGTPSRIMSFFQDTLQTIHDALLTDTEMWRIGWKKIRNVLTTHTDTQSYCGTMPPSSTPYWPKQ